VRSEDSLSSVLLVSRMASEGLKPLKASEYWQLCDRVGRPGVLLGLTEAPLVGEHELEPDLARRIVALYGRATAMAFEVERLDQSGISVLSPFDEDYPQRMVERLGPKAPPLLYAAGNLDLLRRPGLGIVGSADVSAEGATAAPAAAACAARLGLPLVCGGPWGIGRTAMDAAWEADGSVVAMLADPLVRTLKNPDVRRAVHRGAAVMCSPYGPDVPYSAANAAGRERLVYAQSLVTVVVGTVEVIEQGVGTVVVWRGAAWPGAGAEGGGTTAIRSIDDLESLLRGLVTW